jgi:hypothetical protein
MVTKGVIEAAFWGAVLGAAFAVGLVGVPSFGIALLIVFAILAGIIRLRLLARAVHRVHPKS